MVLGREPKISLAELEALFSSSKVKQVAPNLAIVTAHAVSLDRLGGTVKAGQIIDTPIQDYLSNLPAGKITLGISDYSEHANPRKTWELALKYKNLLKRHGRNVRLVPNGKSATISSAASHHNQLGEKTNHIVIVKYGKYTAISIGTQNITAYAKRDRARPARDAFVGMLPPKLAQILVNLATAGAKTGTVLDPFCGLWHWRHPPRISPHGLFGLWYGFIRKDDRLQSQKPQLDHRPHTSAPKNQRT